MLVLRRKQGEMIHIGENVTIMVAEITRRKVKLAIKAPKEVIVHRGEVHEATQRGKPA